MNKRFLITTFGTLWLLVFVLVAASTGWACFPLPVTYVHPSSSGPPGSEVVVNGVDFADGAVEVRWNALDGPLLASGTGPDFSAKAKIPDAPAGVYTIVTLSRTRDASASVRASTVFQVVPAGGAGGLGATPGATSSGATSSPATPPGSAEPSSGGPGTALLVVGGVALLALGGLAGAWLIRRGYRSPEAAP